MADDIDVLANALFTALTADAVTPPTLDLSGAEFSYTAADNFLYADPSDITIDELTTVDLDGTGVYDKMMRTVDLHINREFEDNRITGDQYAKVYTQVMTGVLSNATQFLLTKDQARWQGIAAQMQARVAEIQATVGLIELEKAKLDATRMAYEMQNAGAEYALTKAQIAKVDAEYDMIVAQTAILPVTLAQEQHKLNFQIPTQTDLLTEQVQAARAQTLDTRIDGMTPISGILGKQKESLSLDVDNKQFTVDSTLPAQLNILLEQRESERAKTLDTRSDTIAVAGSIGKQKDLYTQQIDSFIKDAQHKAAKMYLDGWITQKTLDEGLAAPTELQNAGVDAVLAGIRSNNSL